MRRYSEMVKSDVRRRRNPPARQSVSQLSKEVGFDIATLYARRKAWQLQGPVVPPSEKASEAWSTAGKFTVVLESAGGL